MKYKVIALVVAVVVVAAAGAATLVDRTPTMRYVAQHEDTSVPRADAHQGLSIDPETFSSHLPVIVIDTHGQEIPGDVLYVDGKPIIREDGRTVLTTTPEGATDAQVDVRVYDAQDGSPNTLDGTPALESKALIHYRGHRSREFAKRNYSLHLIDDEGMPRDEKVAGMASENAWVLNGPYLDKSLIRNYMAYTLGQHLHVLAPDVRFCELFVDGEYRGLFLIMESVKEASNRVNLSEPTGKGDATSYLLKMDRPDLDAVELDDLGSITEPGRSPFSVLYPSADDLTPGQVEWITQDMSFIEKSLYSYDYDTADYGYWNTLDVDSFVDYFLFNEFTMNYDAGSYSTYLYKDLRGKLTIGPYWDFNSAFDNYVDTSYASCEGFAMVERYWFYMLTKDEKFTDAVIERYRELRQGLLSDENLQAYVDDTVAFLGDAVDRNWEVWGYTFDPDAVRSGGKLDPDERNPRDYEEALDQLRDFIERRGAWLDAHIEDLRQFSHESAVKMQNH